MRKSRSITIEAVIIFIIAILFSKFKEIISDSTVSTMHLTASISSSDYSNTHRNITAVRRSKRYLDFIPLSRMMFRVNVKDNIIMENQFWAQAYGFRANIPIENRRRMRRRDVYDTFETLISNHGFDGRACIWKSICDASKSLSPKSGMLFKLYKLIFGQPTNSNGFSRLPPDDGEQYTYSKLENCDELYAHCPISLLNLTPYTDV